MKALLDAAGVSYSVNPALVRGLDYYGKTVFEWITDSLGAQGTVCAGGRYDGLVEQLGGRPTPAVGFAMGLERLILLLETLELVPGHVNSNADVYVTADLRHHPASEAREAALNGRPYLVDVSHFASEWLWLPAAAAALGNVLTDQGHDVEIQVSTTNSDPWDFILTPG